MSPDVELEKTIDESQQLLTKALDLFDDYNADTSMYVLGWLMAIHVHYVVEHKLMDEDKALKMAASLIRSAYIAQGEDEHE